jgi:hypothetical protein
MITFFRRSGAILVLLAATGRMAILSLGLIIWLLLGTEFAPIQRLICKHDLTTSCVIQEAEAKAAKAIAEADRHVATARAEQEAIRAELAELERRKAELQELHDRLNKIERKASDYAVFHKDRGGRFEVTTGHGYTSLLKANQLSEAWCYLTVGRGNDIRTVFLARYTRIRGLKEDSVPASVMQETGLDEATLASHRARCHWPEGVS